MKKKISNDKRETYFLKLEEIIFFREKKSKLSFQVEYLRSD